MKKLNIILFVAALTLFTSCDSDDSESENGTEVSEASIIGVWNITAFETTNGRSEATIEDQTIVTEFTAVGKDFDATLTINETPQLVESEGSYNTVLTTTAFGESTTQEVEGENFFENTRWRLDGDILYIGAGDVEEVPFTITNLTETQMDLLVIVDEEIEFLGVINKTFATYTMTLTR